MEVSVRSLEALFFDTCAPNLLPLLSLWTSDAVLEAEVRLRNVYRSLCPCDCVYVRWGE